MTGRLITPARREAADQAKQLIEDILSAPHTAPWLRLALRRALADDDRSPSEKAKQARLFAEALRQQAEAFDPELRL